jgi:hypothetical protein
MAEDRKSAKGPSRAATALRRERLRIERLQVWVDLVAEFVPGEGASHVVRPATNLEQIDCDPSVKEALHRALIAACDALEAEAIRDTRRASKRYRPADSPKEG